MAEAQPNTSDKKEEEPKEKSESQECAVCLQAFVHPAQLPCGHIFCYLCVKGIANQSKRCAMCRQEIPRDFIEQPNLISVTSTVNSDNSTYDGAYQWFYEGRNGWWKYDVRTSEEIEIAYKSDIKLLEILICGYLYVIDLEHMFQYPRNDISKKRSIKRDLGTSVAKGVAGWWQYDERTSKELEACYKSGERTCELLIAGFLYIADLDAMFQLRRNDPSRRRRIKRDLATIQKKGVAGIRAEGEQIYSGDIPRPTSPINAAQSDNLTPITPSNTPQTPASGRQSPRHQGPFELEATVERIRLLRLQSNSDSEESEQGQNNNFLWNRHCNGS